MAVEHIALLISVGSLTIAGLSLGWQVAQWLWSGRRPRAHLLHGLLTRTNAAVGPIRRDGLPRNLTHLREQGIDGEEILGIKIISLGRLPIEVESISIHFRGSSMTLVPQREPALVGPDLPHRIEPGSSCSWYVPFDTFVPVIRACRTSSHENITGVYLGAELGDGRTVRTHHTITHK